MSALSCVAFGREMIWLLRVVVLAAWFLPRVIVVASPPILKEVALALKRLAELLVVERVPPLTARLPEVVMSPEDPVILNLVAVTLVAPKEREVSMVEEERSRAVV